MLSIGKKEIKVLWIAFTFPPYGGTQGIWMRKYLEHIYSLSDKNISVDVLTIKPSRSFPQFDPSLEVGFLNEYMEVNRISAGPFHHLRYRWEVENRYKWNGLLKSAISKAIVFLSNVMWVLPASWWIFKRRVRMEGTYDAVYTFADPFYSLVVGAIARSLNKARWVVEYGDPWRIKPATEERSFAIRKLGEFIERWILDKADKVIIMTQSIVKAYSEIYPNIPKDKYLCLYGGVEWEEHDRIVTNPQKNKFIICHTGTLYGDSVNPAPFFNALKEIILEGLLVEVILLGARDATVEGIVDEYGIGSFVTFMGHVSYQEVIAYQKDSALLLAFSCNTPYKILSKLAQYIASKKPILLLTEIEDDSSAKLVEDNNRGLAVPNSVEFIRNAVLEVYKLWDNDRLGDRFNFSPMEEISYGYIARQIKEALGA